VAGLGARFLGAGGFAEGFGFFMCAMVSDWIARSLYLWRFAPNGARKFQYTLTYMANLCCYCNSRECTSDDHIFPQFMGGKKTVRACKPCNDRFGHTFEATVSSTLAPLVIKFREAGIISPRRVVWKRAFQREGIDFDLDSDLKAQPSKAVVSRDESQKFIRGIFPSEKAAASFLRGARADGKRVEVTTKQKQEAIHLPLDLRIEISTELRRLVMKIAVATAESMGFREQLLDNIARSFLLGEIEQCDYVRRDFQIHKPLEALRTPLSHLVYVKGNNHTGHCYAVVQFYGFLQYYAILNDTGFKALQFACAASLDVAKGYKEKFWIVEPIGIPKAPAVAGSLWMKQMSKNWRDKFSNEAEQVLGKGKLAFDTGSLESYNY
jgi:HNH endonuclease